MTNRKAQPEELLPEPPPVGRAYINANGLIFLADGSVFARIVTYTPDSEHGRLAARMVDWLNSPASKPSAWGTEEEAAKERAARLARLDETTRRNVLLLFWPEK